MADAVEIKVTLDTAQANRQARKLRDDMEGSEGRSRRTLPPPGTTDSPARKPARRAGGRGARAGAGAAGRAAKRARAASAAAHGGARPGMGAARALGGARAAFGEAAAALAGGIAIEQAVGRGASTALEAVSLAIRSNPEIFKGLMMEFLPSMVDGVLSSPQLAQKFSDEALQLSDEIMQKITFEVVRAQTARAEVVDILSPFARAGLPSGSLGGYDGSFSEPLVRKRRREAFLERQEARRKGEGAALFTIDYLRGLMGG